MLSEAQTRKQKIDIKLKKLGWIIISYQQGLNTSVLYSRRGLFFFTGKQYYQDLTAMTGIDLINHPDLLSNMETSVMTTCAYWQKKQLNKRADAKDFIRIFKVTYGGNPNAVVMGYFEKAQKEFQIK